ncbi:MAG: phosphate transport system permease protein [Erysipelotrichaceae bacterium]|nr:MAG: phosphate transport system permease [Erysipelotrichaceae bacterium]TXT19247.1 MAG: phosphate transport system permease protein [Erysipelotrichaceae bacterium]
MTKKKKRWLEEKSIEWVLIMVSVISILTTVGIVMTLFYESYEFFTVVSIKEFFTTLRWAPVFDPPSFGVLPLLSGTFLIAFLSSFISLPLGLGSAIYLSEFASKKARKIIKPILELLAGIPSIVYGFFALTFITPIIRSVLPDTSIYNALSASIAVGIMTLPMVASLSEDAMMAVPDSIRQGAYALGSTKLEVAIHVIVPAAFSGIGASFMLAISRAVGETMIVAIAAGQTPTFTLNPLESVQTMTGFMVNMALGDIQQGSIEFKTVFVVGALLFLVTLVMNFIAKFVIQKNREVY